MAKKFAQNHTKSADDAAGTGAILAVIMWAVFSVFSIAVMRPYVMTSATSPEAIEYAVVYGNIVCVGSLGSFLEGIFTKVHQAHGNMRLPMIAQIAGAVTNIVFDPILIFGMGPIPSLGVAGAAYATVMGQVVSAIITGIKGFRRPPDVKKCLHYAKHIYFFGYSSIGMQALYTVYILALNIILSKFSDAAVTVLGLYYKMQSFFFIPLFGLETCIVPIISFNYTKKNYDRCRKTMRATFIISGAFMILGIVFFVFFPDLLISIFSNDELVHKIGDIAFPIIGSSFISATFSLMMPVFFQAIGKGKSSLLLSLTRQIFCLVPVFWMFSFIGVDYTWLSFPISETVSGLIGVLIYIHEIRSWNNINCQSENVQISDPKI